MSKRNISQVLTEFELAEGSTESKQRVTREDLSPASAVPHHEPTTSSGSAASSAPNEAKSTLFPYPNPYSQTPPKSTPFQQPTPLTSFSYTPQHVLEFTNSALRYYREPPLGAQLGYGYERWIRRPEERSRIDSLLRAVERVTDDGPEKRMNLEDVGVVAWRGVMTRILTALYEDRDRWEMNAMLVNGTLYLEEHRTDASIAEKNNIEPRHRKMMYYGYAFESYCTTDDLHSHSNSGPPHPSHTGNPPGWGGDVDTNVQWCSVVRTKLGDTRLIIGGEVDCVRGQYKGTTDTFMELKTSMTIRGAADEARFEKKLLKFYVQSFLLGVPEIVVGFRTPSGQLSTTQSFKTIQIPRMVREKAGVRGTTRKESAWDPSRCLDWGYRFLTYLKQAMARESEDDPVHREDPAKESKGAKDQPTQTNAAKAAQVWRIKFVPGEGASAMKLDGSAVAEVENGEQRVGFLPSWFWDKATSMPKASSSNSSGGSTAGVQPVHSAVAGWQI